MNLRAGTLLSMIEHSWERIDPDERTPSNSVLWHNAVRVVGCEWLPPHQRMVVRLVDGHGREFNLTRRELAHNRVTEIKGLLQ